MARHALLALISANATQAAQIIPMPRKDLITTFATISHTPASGGAASLPDREPFFSRKFLRRCHGFFGAASSWNLLTTFFGRLFVRRALLFSLVRHKALSRRLSRSALS